MSFLKAIIEREQLLRSLQLGDLKLHLNIQIRINFYFKMFIHLRKKE